MTKREQARDELRALTEKRIETIISLYHRQILVALFLVLAIIVGLTYLLAYMVWRDQNHLYLAFLEAIAMAALCLLAALFFFGLWHMELRYQALRITKPPGTSLRTLAELVYSTKTYKAVFQPLLAEFQYEYFDALSKGRIHRASWLRVVYFFAFCKAAGLDAGLNLLSGVIRRA